MNPQDTVIVAGNVKSIIDANYGTRLILRKCELVFPEYAILNTKIQVYSRVKLFDLRKGDRVVIKGVIDLPERARNPGEFDYRNYLYRKGIRYILYARDRNEINILEKKNDLISSWDAAIQAKIDQVISSSVSEGENAAILKALLLGKREEVSKEVIRDFVDSGVIHVLAVSGLHVGYITLVFIFIFGLARISRGYRELMVILGLIFYSWIVDFRPSVVRASVMAALILMAGPLQRRSNIFNSLAAAGFVILVFDPLQLWQIGFQLSFSAVFAIVYFYPKFVKIMPDFLKPANIRYKIPSWLWQLFIVSLAAQIGTLPFTIYYFNRIPIISLLMNLMVIPLVSVIGGLGFALVMLGLFFPIAGVFYGEIERILLVILKKLIALGAHAPFAYIQTPDISISGFLIVVVLIFFLTHLEIQRIRKIMVFSLLIAGNLLIWKSALGPGEMKITFLDVGQGDCAFFRFTDGKTMMIDTGARSFHKDMGARVIVPFLKGQGIRRINYLILTHPHSDHIGGAPAVLREVPVDTVMMPDCQAGSKLFREVIQLIDSCGAVRLNVSRGMIRKVGESMIFFMHPDTLTKRYKRTYNNYSVTVKIIRGNFSLLLTGDLEANFEHFLTGYGHFLRSDILKVGHHGSRTSSSERFIDLISPGYAVISVEKFNKFGHPSDEVIERLKKKGSQILRTDGNGAVIFEITGKEIKYHTMITEE